MSQEVQESHFVAEATDRISDSVKQVLGWMGRVTADTHIWCQNERYKYSQTGKRSKQMTDQSIVRQVRGSRQMADKSLSQSTDRGQNRKNKYKHSSLSDTDTVN